MTNTQVWAQLGITSLDPESIGPWLWEHTDRDHVLFGTEDEAAWSAFETFLHRRVRPLFEGPVG